MTLKEYIDQLNEFAETHDAMEFQVCYAIDDEGNAFGRVVYAPSLGCLDKYNEFTQNDEEANAVCIN